MQALSIIQRAPSGGFIGQLSQSLDHLTNKYVLQQPSRSDPECEQSMSDHMINPSSMLVDIP